MALKSKLCSPNITMYTRDIKFLLQTMLQEERIKQRLKEQILKRRKEEEQRRQEEEEKLTQQTLEAEQHKVAEDEETHRRFTHTRQSSGSEKPSKLRQPSVNVGDKMRTPRQAGSDKGRQSKADSPRKSRGSFKGKEGADGTKSADPSVAVRVL